MSASSPVHQRSKRGWRVLISLLASETLAGLIALVPLGSGFFAASSGGSDTGDFGQRVSVLLAGLLAILWVVITFVGALRTRASWARGSAVALHVLMFAAGTGALQYRLAEPWISWMLVLFALVGFFSALIARPEYVEAPSEGDE
ncbi:MAG: hypothetical protein J0H64_07145 [Actinobacteria bacterium]|nr:hypothetical protein [Actinomycetota bacterium]